MASVSIVDRTFIRPGRASERDRFHQQRVQIGRMVDSVALDVVLVSDGTTSRVRLCGLESADQADAVVVKDWWRGAAEKRWLLVLDDRGAPRDANGVLAAYLWSDDGTMLNEEMLRLGLARADRAATYALKLRFIRQEEAARRRGDGMWRGEKSRPSR